MSVFIVPTPQAPFRQQRTRLDGVDYLIAFIYNQRENRIYLSLADNEENPIISGIKVVANYPLLFRHRYNPAVPPGELIAVDTTTDGSPPGLGELGEGLRCQLMYFDGAEIAALGAGPPVVQVPIFVAIRVARGGGYIGDAAFATALASACGAAFGIGSIIAAAGITAPAGSGGTITGIDIGQSAPSPAPSSIASTVIRLASNQQPLFSASQISVVSS